MGKVNYTKPDTSAWQEKCDDLFLAQFRGTPCEVCGVTGSSQMKKKKVMYIRSCGHHIMEKDQHRIYRYDARNIVVLCPTNHGRYTRTLSPHSSDTVAVAAFYEWLRVKRPEKWDFLKAHGRDEWDNSWTYRDKYVELGGKLTDEKFLKDCKPDGHTELIRGIEARAKGATK